MILLFIIEDYINYYNVDTDMDGTWRNFVEHAEEFKNASDFEKNPKYRGPGIQRDLKAAWRKLKWSERKARDKMEEFLHDYYQNYKGVDPHIVLDLADDDKEVHTGTFEGYQKFANPKEKAEALKERTRIKEERYKELMGEKGDQEIRTGSRKSDVKKLKNLSQEDVKDHIKRKYDTPSPRYHRSFLETSTGKQDKYLGDGIYSSDLKNNDDDDYNKYSGGVIRNPYSYAPRDI